MDEEEHLCTPIRSALVDYSRNQFKAEKIMEEFCGTYLSDEVRAYLTIIYEDNILKATRPPHGQARPAARAHNPSSGPRRNLANHQTDTGPATVR